MTKEKKPPRGVRRRGDSLFVTFTLKDGSLERRSVGPISIREAVEERETFKRQVRLGTYEKKRPAPEKPKFFTVTDLWDAYLRAYCNQDKKDAGRLKIAWNSHLKAKFEKVRVEDVSTYMIEEYISARRGPIPNSDRETARPINATINRELATLKAMFHHGEGVTPPMVLRVPKFPKRLKECKPRQGFVKDAEYALLAANAKPLWLRTLVAVAYFFGFRKSEMLHLRCGKVDLLDRIIELEDTKNGDTRKVQMTAEVYGLILACVRGKKDDDYVFTREDGSRVADPRDDWYSLCVASGLGRWEPAKRNNGKDYMRYVGLNLHDFRRSAIRNMTRRGISETVAMKISGHHTPSVFRRYNIIDTDDLAEAARKIETGSQPVIPAVKSDTKSDTSSFAESLDSRNSLN
jgi:integrase